MRSSKEKKVQASPSVVKRSCVVWKSADAYYRRVCVTGGACACRQSAFSMAVAVGIGVKNRQRRVQRFSRSKQRDALEQPVKTRCICVQDTRLQGERWTRRCARRENWGVFLGEVIGKRGNFLIGAGFFSFHFELSGGN